MSHATHATNDYTTTARTAYQQFHDSDKYDCILFHVSMPVSDESDPLIATIIVSAFLVGEERICHYGELPIDKSAFYGLSHTGVVFKCIECAHEACGFGEPTPGFQICANTDEDGVIFAMRWSMSKKGRVLSQTQIRENVDFLGAYGHPNFVTLDYGIHHVNLNQRINPRLVGHLPALN